MKLFVSLVVALCSLFAFAAVTSTIVANKNEKVYEIPGCFLNAREVVARVQQDHADAKLGLANVIYWPLTGLAKGFARVEFQQVRPCGSNDKAFRAVFSPEQNVSGNKPTPRPSTKPKDH